MRRKVRKQKGFILVVVVLMLAILCLLVTQISSLVHQRSNEIQREEDQLSARWTLVSLRRILQANGLSMLDRLEWEANVRGRGTAESAAQYIARYDTQIQLRDTDLRLEIRDASALLPLVRLAEIGKQNLALDGLQRFENTSMPQWDGMYRTEANGCFLSFARWQARTKDRLSPEPPQRCSLWGDGRINLYRCEEESLIWLWQELFGRYPPEELWLARSQYPAWSWEKLRIRCRLGEEELRIADQLFTTESQGVELRIRLGSQEWLFGQNESGIPFGVRLR